MRDYKHLKLSEQPDWKEGILNGLASVSIALTLCAFMFLGEFAKCFI